MAVHCCEDPKQERLEEAMPWVGLYIAAASAVCTLAMAADAFNGFRRKKLWFPCKYFSLNATSLTLLGVATKLLLDLTTVMNHMRIAKFSSLIFISTAMGNFMSSLGSMNDKHILANVVALGILVITITADVLIRFIVLQSINFYMVPMILMLLSLATLVSLAITVPATKRSLETMYQEQHKVALREEVLLERKEAFRIDDQRRYMMKYWVMAETSSPQFVMARSVVCTTSAVICLLALIALAIAHIVSWTIHTGPSPYGASTKWILHTQTTGVLVGTIAPMLRWLVVVGFKCSTTNTNSFRKGIKIETYWIQTMVDWRDSFSALHIPQGKYRKCFHDAKWFAVTFCIGLQILIVILSKLFVVLSALLMSPFFLCLNHIKKFVKQIGHEADGDKDLNLSRYVLLLEGEVELPRSVLRNICREADSTILKGRKKQPQNLVNLLHKFVNFYGVGEFDSNQIPSLCSKEPPNCWVLPVVTLTSIAIALPNIAKDKGKRLLSSVSEGLSLAKLVEETLVKNAQLVNIRKAGDICWVGLVLYMRWLEVDLRTTSLKCKNSKAVSQKLSNKAEKIVSNFKGEAKDATIEDTLNWPAKVVAANSMYRISRTILLSYEEENDQTDERLFERLSVMIADILAACLTNLPRVITTMCHSNAIEKREQSVREAFLLLGKTEQIVELLHQQEWPPLDHEKAASIDKWRDLFRKNKDDPETSTTISCDKTTTRTPVPSEEQIAITLDS